MSQKSFLEFALTARDSSAVLARYSRHSLSQLLFHAKNEGYEFSEEDAAQFVVKLEFLLITTKDDEEMAAASSLWQRMWGRTHLDYFVTQVLPRFTDEELAALAAGN
jgi:hypothetical protein